MTVGTVQCVPLHPKRCWAPRPSVPPYSDLIFQKSSKMSTTRVRVRAGDNMKNALAVLILPVSLLFQTACATVSDSQAERSSVQGSPESRMETWFRFHSTLLDEMRKCPNYKELTLKDDWARSVRLGIRRDIYEWDFSPHERDELLRRLRIAQGEGTLAYVDTFIPLRSAAEDQLLYIKSTINSIDRSMDLWDEPETIHLKIEQTGICANEAIAMIYEAQGLGLQDQFSACMTAASDASKRAVTLLSQGPEIRQQLRRNR